MRRSLGSATMITLALLAAGPGEARQRDRRIEGRWRVVAIDHSPVPHGVPVAIKFGRDGRASGQSGCNRFTSTYRLDGRRLRFGPVAGTRMACLPPRMETEARFLRELGQVTHVEFANARRLQLKEERRTRILAERL